MKNLKWTSKIMLILALGFIIESSLMVEGWHMNSFSGFGWATDEPKDQYDDLVENKNTFDPHADIQVTKTHYVITMELPGVRKDEINVEVINKWQVVISGQKKKPEGELEHYYHTQERQFGTFVRNILLPDDAHTDEVDAEFKNGILTVHVMRSKPIGSKIKVKRKRVEIN